jgi:phospholipid N-methyltransferase
MNTKEEILKQCTVDGNVVKLPSIQLDRKEYLEISKAIELIGGKWKGGKISGFVFTEDPTELLKQISTGEKRNLKKEFQFFGTPELLAEKLVSYADVEITDSILEPSAGQGAIIKAIQKELPNKTVDYCELMELNQVFLSKISNTNFICSDFFDVSNGVKYDKIIANPPFSKNQDIDHVYNMYDHLNDGGRLVSITSKHWQFSSFKKEKAFNEWVMNNATHIEEIPAGSFKESGTNISGLILVIDK